MSKVPTCKVHKGDHTVKVNRSDKGTWLQQGWKDGAAPEKKKAAAKPAAKKPAAKKTK